MEIIEENKRCNGSKNKLIQTSLRPIKVGPLNELSQKKKTLKTSHPPPTVEPINEITKNKNKTIPLSYLSQPNP